MGKLTKVTLSNKKLGVTEDFEINHAERLLRMPNNGGWELPVNSEYNFSETNGIGLRKTEKIDTRKEKDGGSK